MKHVIVRLPNKHDRRFRLAKQEISNGRAYENLGQLFVALEQYLPRPQKPYFSHSINTAPGSLKEKTVLSVRDGSTILNETLPSKKPGYLLYCGVLFLEDYLRPEFLNARAQKYLPFSMEA